VLQYIVLETAHSTLLTLRTHNQVGMTFL